MAWILAGELIIVHRIPKWNNTGCVQVLLSDAALFERYQSPPNRRGKRKVRIAILSV